MRQFPRLRATEFRKDLGTGSTHPCVLDCENENEDAAGEVVVKLRSEVRAGGLCFEFVAAHLAEHLALPMPESVLVEIDEDLPETVAGNPAVSERLRKSVGLNFGTRYLTAGYTTWPKDEPIPEALRSATLEIVAFDALIENPDRRRDKPNVLWRGEELLVIDHEMAFGFVFPLVGVGEDTPRIERLAFLKNHLYYPGLRGRDDLDLTQFTEALAELTDDALDEICEATPPEFGEDYLDTIKNHVCRARQEGAAFGTAVIGVLR